ncbi:hypothetical protein HN743_04075 [Candidatus Woesearchaeota archaeon]|jgi:hypothetical protein|nr:hypothetical protein [Candidatus Woesearchaeota archaeon]MBT7787208.1 hypothetical protein [Candidatus Woesearchaeota archaeon]
MSESTKNALKFRINTIYRIYLLLNYYQSSLLKNSPPTPEHLEKLNQVKQLILTSTEPHVQQISAIQDRTLHSNDYIDPLKISADTLSTEFFFQSQPRIEEILKIYETNLRGLIDEFQISPMDQMKLTKISFI